MDKTLISRWAKGERAVSLEQLRVLVGLSGPGHIARAQAVLRALAAELGAEIAFTSVGPRVGTAASEALDVDEAVGALCRAIHRDAADGRIDDGEAHHAALDRVEREIAELRAALPRRAAR